MIAARKPRGPRSDLRRRVWEVLELARPGDRLSRAFHIVIFILIILNVLAVMAQSVEVIDIRHARAFALFELASVTIFSAEYLLRVWSCVESPDYARPVTGRIRFMLTPMAFVDLLAILPFYVFILTIDLRSLRVLRLTRILRVAKLGRYSRSLRMIGNVFRERREELVLSFAMMAMLVIVAACLMYYAEHEAQPRAFPHIPAAMWWAVVTLTTVGYGDVFPVTGAGRILGAVIAILGIGMFALPTGLFGAAFAEAIRRQRQAPRTCPHCGRPID